MSAGDPAPSPSRVLCPDCAHDVTFTDLGVAEHRVRHLEWEHRFRPANTTWGQHRHLENLVDAYRAYTTQLEEYGHRLRQDINDRDARIADLGNEIGRLADEIDDLVKAAAA